MCLCSGGCSSFGEQPAWVPGTVIQTCKDRRTLVPIRCTSMCSNGHHAFLRMSITRQTTRNTPHHDTPRHHDEDTQRTQKRLDNCPCRRMALVLLATHQDEKP